MADQTKFIAEILEAVGAEFDGRVDAELSEKDRLAVATAMGKAAVRGFLRGAAETAAQLNTSWVDVREHLVKLLPPSVSLPNVLASLELQVVEPDMWAEAYQSPNQGDA